MKTGDILLVSGTSKQAEIIQKFQCKVDPESGVYNHSGIILVTKNDIYVVEEAPIEGYKLKAAAVINPIEHYTEGDYQLKVLTPLIPVDEKCFEQILFEYIGIPYDYESLLRGQILRIILNWWIGRKHDKGWKRMVCHEFTQFIWHTYRNIFPEYYKGDVSKIYHSKDFK